MSKELIIHAGSSDVHFALLQEGRLVELHKQNLSSAFSVGDVVFAKIKRVVSGLSAAFVDVGDYKKEGFLHYSDLGPNVKATLEFVQRASVSGNRSVRITEKLIPKEPLSKDGDISEVLKPKQNILVQITKEPISTKGPRLSAELSIPGRYLILVPFSDKVTASQKIQNRTESKRLCKLIESIKPKGFGVIIRTAAIDKKVADLDKDLSRLHKKWLAICKDLSKVSPPTKVLSEVDKAFSIIRDMFDDSFTNIYVDDKKLYEQVKNYVEKIIPNKTNIVKYFDSIVPIFEKFGIERQIKAFFGRTVMMSKGAYLVIEHTEALHVIDVNSGGQSNKSKTQQDTALNVNLIAAEEISKQLRLRDMGGIIVIDFIDMKKAEDRKQLYDFFKEKMQQDRAKHRILPPSKIGLIQMTRQRVRPELNINTDENNPSLFDGKNVMPPILLVRKITDLIDNIITNKKHKNGVILNIHPFIAAFLTKGMPSVRMKWFLTHKVWVRVIARDAYSYLEYRIKDKKGSILKID